jgi:hypothetical protein
MHDKKLDIVPYKKGMTILPGTVMCSVGGTYIKVIEDRVNRYSFHTLDDRRSIWEITKDEMQKSRWMVYRHLINSGCAR